MTDSASLLEKLPPRHRAFVRLVHKNGGNAAKAYVDAGFSRTAANANAARLIAKDSVSSALAALRAETEVIIARKTVADMLELEEHFTAEVRGDAYFSRISRLERRLEQKEKALAMLQESAASPNLNPVEKAMLGAKIMDATKSIFDAEALIAQIHIAGRNESNKAGVTLLKLKGAFDAKRLPMNDPMAVLNDVARNILRAKVKPSQLLETMRAQARDADFSMGAGDGQDDARSPAGGAGETGRSPLFSRTLPPAKTP